MNGEIENVFFYTFNAVSVAQPGGICKISTLFWRWAHSLPTFVIKFAISKICAWDSWRPSVGGSWSHTRAHDPHAGLPTYELGPQRGFMGPHASSCRAPKKAIDRSPLCREGPSCTALIPFTKPLAAPLCCF